MAGKAENMLPFNSQAVKKAGAKNGARTEWRIEGVRGLVLFCQPSGIATWFFFYTVRIGALRKLRKVQIGGRDAVTLAEARAAAEEMLRVTEKGGDPVADMKAKRDAITFRKLAETFLAKSATLAAGTRRHYEACLERDAYPVIGDVPAAEVTADHIISVCRRIEEPKDAKRRSSTTLADRTKTAIGGVYRWALRERRVPSQSLRWYRSSLSQGCPDPHPKRRRDWSVVERP